MPFASFAFFDHLENSLDIQNDHRFRSFPADRRYLQSAAIVLLATGRR